MSRAKDFFDELCDAGAMPGFGSRYGETPDYLPVRPEPRDDFAARMMRERIAAINTEPNGPQPEAPKPRSAGAPKRR